jgi:hypothetical protein
VGAQEFGGFWAGRLGLVGRERDFLGAGTGIEQGSDGSQPSELQ